MLTTTEKLFLHFDESEQYFPRDKIVGIFLQGSQNYGLDIETSDVDTKLIVVPSFKEIAMNKKPVSTTHVRANEEHIDFKDIRLYMDTFKKQNLNFLEILFTDYKIINALYAKEWSRLIAAREKIARMNPYRAVKSMKGIAMEKFHAMKHEYPSKIEVLAKYGYDPKQLHHLLRVEDYLERYIRGEKYEDCLRPTNPEYLIDVKRGKFDLTAAENLAAASIAHVTEMADKFCELVPEGEDPEMAALLADVQYQIMKISIAKELKGMA